MNYYRIKNKLVNIGNQTINSEINYIVETTSDNGIFKEGDRFGFEYEKRVDEWNNNEVTYKFNVFSPPETTNIHPTLGMAPLNRVDYYDTEEEFKDALKGIKLIPRMEYYHTRKAELLKELQFLEDNYNQA